MNETLVTVANAALAKSHSLRKTPLGYFVLSMMAGAYVGLGIVLIFAVGAPFAAASSPWTKTVMGAAFGIALSLVIFAGSELFTGNVMVMTVGALRRRVSAFDLGAVWTVRIANAHFVGKPPGAGCSTTVPVGAVAVHAGVPPSNRSITSPPASIGGAALSSPPAASSVGVALSWPGCGVPPASLGAVDVGGASSPTQPTKAALPKASPAPRTKTLRVTPMPGL